MTEASYICKQTILDLFVHFPLSYPHLFSKAWIYSILDISIVPAKFKFQHLSEVAPQ